MAKALTVRQRNLRCRDVIGQMQEKERKKSPPTKRNNLKMNILKDYNCLDCVRYIHFYMSALWDLDQTKKNTWKGGGCT